mgnify:FL=1
MKLLDFINKKTNNAYLDFKLVSVIFDRANKECVFKFLYKNEIKDSDKPTLTKLIQEYLPQDVSVVVKCKKAYIDSDLVRDVIHNFITKHYSSVAVDFEKSDINVNIDGDIYVTINCNKFNYNHLSNPAVYSEITTYCEGFFFEPFHLEIIAKKDEKEEVEEVIIDNPFLDDISTTNSKIKNYKVKDIQNIIGEVNGCPIEISSIEGAMDSVEISGTIKFFTQKTFESKRVDKEGNAVVKTYFSFSLVDKTGKMSCVIFPRKDCAIKMVNFKDGDYVIVHGNIEDYNGRINFKADAIAYCVREEEQVEEPTVEIKQEPYDHYLCVKTEPYFEISQDNLFAVSEEIGDYLMNNDVVVFDIETTGLEVSRCEIIEIGAVKLHKGKKVETFETFVKPTTPIPEEITNLTHITDEMVKDAPSIKNVIADFYKFCYGTTIIAYNIDFDYKFVSTFGRNNGFIFDMKQIDALYLARAFIPGLKNFKLGTVCKKLGVSLENAHRAVHDAMATADVVIKLNTNIT